MTNKLIRGIPDEVVEQIAQLAESHERTFNGEVVWALREYAKKARSKMYTIQFEIETDDQETVNDTMYVEAESEDRALEHATNVLEEKYEGGTLLECKAI